MPTFRSTRVTGAISFDCRDATEFEQFAHNLLRRLGCESRLAQRHAWHSSLVGAGYEGGRSPTVRVTERVANSFVKTLLLADLLTLGGGARGDGPGLSRALHPQLSQPIRERRAGIRKWESEALAQHAKDIHDLLHIFE